jgi:putative endonuclease
MYYVYLIKNEKGNIYIGYTKDVDSRVGQHNRGENISTKGYKWELIYYEAYRSEEDARRIERKLKQRGQAVRHLKERVRDSIE